jgi:hypothetical protein
VIRQFKARIAYPENTSIARQRPVNIFPQQPQHAPASTIPGQLLGNSPLNTSVNDRGIIGSSVLCSVRNNAIYRENLSEVSGRLDKRPSIFMRGNPSSHQRGCFIGTTTTRVQLKKISCRDPEGDWCQDELIGSNP